MAQQFEQPSEAGTLRTQRMTADETRAVIELWQQERVEQTGLTDKPAVPDVAEGLDISVEDVQRLLGVVRARQKEEARLLAQEQALSEIRLAEGQRQLAEIQRQQAEIWRQQAELRREQAEALRRPQISAHTPERSSHNSCWAEVLPGAWEDAEPTVNEVSPPEAARLVKASSVLIVLGVFLLGPFALLVYEMITGFSLR